MRLTPLAHAHGLLVAAAFGLVSASAFAQTEEAPAAPPPPETAPAPMNTPEPGTTPGPAAAAPAAPYAPEATPAAPAPEAAADAPVAEETFPAAWFRIDSDLFGLQLWAGATHMITDTIGIATDMYVTSGTIGELDIGPAFAAGPVTVTPMIGLQADWAAFEAVSLVPQLFVTGGPDPIYMELWLQGFMNSVFNDTAGANTLYGRFFLDYKVGKYFAIGPEIEMTLGLNDAAKPGGDTLLSLPIGANIMLPNYGQGNNFFIFAGYETQDTPNDSHLAGRLTFVRNF
jgi:hypothetical protein